jgi:hypothetical protein
VVCDNDFVWGWSRDRENNGNTGDTRIFLTGSTLSEDNSPMTCVLVLLMAIDIFVDLVVGGCPCPPFISKGIGVTRKVLESITIVVLVELYL